MSACPKCNSEIADASYCGCGWRRAKAQVQDDPRPFVACAHDDCRYRARAKVKTPLGWANLCADHYEQKYLTEARTTCERLGLVTVDQRRAYVRAAMRKLAAKWEPVYQREPGEDLDEVAA